MLPQSRRAPYPLLVLFVVLATAVAALAHRYHLAQKDAVAHEVQNQLLSVADMKVRHIEAWRAEKLGEARALVGNPLMLAALERVVQGRSTPGEKQMIADWMESLRRELHYGGVTLTDAGGNVVMTRGRIFGAPEHLRELAIQTARETDVSLTDFHVDTQGAPIHLGLNAPLRVAPGAAGFGALLGGLDPEDYLFPLLERWPTPSKSAESLLVRRDGEQVVFLSPLRKRPNLQLNLHIPMSEVSVAAVRALMGERGAIEAKDYAGAPVFAVVQPVPGTSWRVVAKIDADEVLAPLQWRSALMGALAISLILAAGAGVLALWRRNEVRWYRDQYQGEIQRRETAERYDAERKSMNEELRRANLALQISEHRFRLAFEQAAVGINEVSLDGRFQRVNQRFCDITGYAREELLRMTLADLTYPEDRDADRFHIDSVVSGELLTDRWEKRYIRKDGAIIWVAITASLPRDASGEPLYLLGVVEDITAAVHAQEALRQTEERFRQVVENAPEGIVVTKGVEARYLNPAAARLFGAASAAQLIGSPVLDRIRSDHRGVLRERLAEVTGGTPSPQAELTFVRLNGEVFPVEVSATPIVYDGQASALVFFRDVTDRKQAEEERARLEQRLRQAQKMESVGRLAGGVAHDFNNHLTVINGYCDMLLDALAPDDPLRDELGEIRAAGDRAAALTQQLLAFSRKQVVEPRPLLMNDVVEEFCRMVRRLIGDDIEVVTDLDPALGPVLADRGQMHQVLMNLAVNARDAMPDGGTIRIATANVVRGDVEAASDAQPGPFVSLAVSDTGIGMSAETLQKIFEPFFTTKPLGIGTGLGLATVYGIVQQSDGIVRVASQPGEGTTFRIYLPRIEDEEGVAVVAAPTQEGLLGTETILVVEDQEEVRRLAVGILRRHGYRVLEGANGTDALSTAEGFAGAIDLLVTDVIMPGMTGRELAQRMVRVRPGLKVLYMSGYSADLLAKDGLTSGSLSYLPKPFAPAELARKVREVLGGSRPKGRILVIDDDASVREVLAGILGAAGYEVETAADGDAGVRALEANPIRLLITDLVMPHLEGLEVLKLVRERFPGIPVIAVSGALDGEFLKAATALGAGAALLKPIAADQLIPEVKRLIG